MCRLEVGVDYDVAYAAVASIYGSKERLLIGGQESDEKQKRLNALDYAFQLEAINIVEIIKNEIRKSNIEEIKPAKTKNKKVS